MAIGNEGLSIADMDFGDFISTSGALEEPEVKKVKEPELEIETEEDEPDLLEALDKTLEQDKIEDKIESPAPADESDKTDEPFTLVLARYQLEQGILSSLDEEKLQEIIANEGESAALTYLIQNEVETNSKAIEGKLDEYSKEYADLRKAGFSGEEAGNAVFTLETLDSITEDALQDEDNEDLRRTILKENYKATTSFSESKIDRLVKRSFDINADVEDAIEALETLREAKKNGIQEQKLSRKKEQDNAQEVFNQQIRDLTKHIESLDEIVPGQKVTKQTKTKISDILTKPVKQSEEGYALNAIWNKRSENPISFDTTLAYLYLSGVFDGKWDQITKSVNTKLTNKLEEKLKTGSTSLLGGKPTIQKSHSEIARENMIGPMKHLFRD